MEEIIFSIIIPAYNEEEGIGKTCSELCRELDFTTTEVIVVNDGSTDRTAESVSEYEHIRLVSHRKNCGYGSGIRTGTKAACGKYVIWYDADGQHRPEDLKKVMDALQKEDLDYCIGVRGGDSYEESNRKLGKWILKKFIRMVAGEQVKDFNSGLRGFRREILMCYLPLLPKGFGASTVTTLLMMEQEFYGMEVPIRVRRRIGKSSVRQFRDGMRTMALIFDISLLFRPFQVFGTIGLTLFVAGLIYGIGKALLVGFGMPILAFTMMSLGIQIICIGVLSNQISSMRKERFYTLYENESKRGMNSNEL